MRALPAFDWWLPPNASTFGERVDALFFLILIVTGIMFVLTEGAIVVFLIRFRHNPSRRSAYIHDHRAVETVWTAVPACVLVFLALSQQSTWETIKMDMPDPQDARTVNVRVIARQFNWTFWYAGKDGRFGTADDFDDAVLKVPVSDPGPDGRWNTDDDIQSKVLLEMRSRDVIHSFFLPHMRLKQDVLPGMKTRAWFAATRTGTFEIACAELCGAQHYSMSASLEVVEHRDFLDYLERRAGKMTVKGPNEHGEDELLAAWWQRVFPE